MTTGNLCTTTVGAALKRVVGGIFSSPKTGTQTDRKVKREALSALSTTSEGRAHHVIDENNSSVGGNDFHQMEEKHDPLVVTLFQGLPELSHSSHEVEGKIDEIIAAAKELCRNNQGNSALIAQVLRDHVRYYRRLPIQIGTLLDINVVLCMKKLNNAANELEPMKKRSALDKEPDGAILMTAEMIPNKDRNRLIDDIKRKTSTALRSTQWLDHHSVEAFVVIVCNAADDLYGLTQDYKVVMKELEDNKK